MLARQQRLHELTARQRSDLLVLCIFLFSYSSCVPPLCSHNNGLSSEHTPASYILKHGNKKITQKKSLLLVTLLSPQRYEELSYISDSEWPSSPTLLVTGHHIQVPRSRPLVKSYCLKTATSTWKVLQWTTLSHGILTYIALETEFTEEIYSYFMYPT